MNCRHCNAPLQHVLIDLGHQPASNAYLSAAMLRRNEVYSPLKVFICNICWLGQLPSHHDSHELFTADYAYFSSVSSTWLAHSERYVDAMIERFALTDKDWVVEIASNDGYLLQFVQRAGIPCTGIEPTASTAAMARAKGIESLEQFFGVETASELVKTRGHARLTAANNVLAHVPNINDFVGGFKVLLAPDGVATFEFPQLMTQMAGAQFDTIYHEHYSYLSLTAVKRIFASQGLRVFDVENLPTHGGSLRVFACQENSSHPTTDNVGRFLAEEHAAGIETLAFYAPLAAKAAKVKLDLLEFLVQQKKADKTVAAYGAAAKGNTLLNYSGVHADLLSFVCDAAPSKQGKYMPGSHVPILPPAAMYEQKPDFVLILPWNLQKEVTHDHARISQWGGKFVVAIPELKIL